MRIVYFILLICLFEPTQAAHNITWPQLIDNLDNIICKNALKIASSTYYSNNISLSNNNPIIPTGLNNTFVFYPSTEGFFKFTKSSFDESIFKKFDTDQINIHSHPNQTVYVYWQINPIHNLRYIIVESPFGSDKYIYDFFIIKESINYDQFINDFKNASHIPLASHGWRQPLAVKEDDSNELWIIDVGNQVDILSPWKIHFIDVDGTKQQCNIEFYPKKNNKDFLLPKPVEKLAKLLIKTLGSTDDEGSLRHLSIHRTEIRLMWANVALRPWVYINKEAYNSRNKIDTELRKWSNKSKSFKKIYNEIHWQYPRAQNALACYYEVQFNMNFIEANELAEQLLDFAFKSNFIFSNSN